MRHRSVDEHQLEVLGLLAGKAVVGEEAGAQGAKRVRLAARRFVGGALDHEEALLGEREEDLVLAGEVAINGSGAVLNTFGDLAHRHGAVAFGDEQLPRGVKNGVAHRRAFTVLTFLDSHLNCVPGMNTVRLNSVHEDMRYRRAVQVICFTTSQPADWPRVSLPWRRGFSPVGSGITLSLEGSAGLKRLDRRG